MKDQKSLFALDPKVHYLNCSYKAPMLRSVAEAGQSAMQKSLQPYTISPDDFFDGQARVRNKFAQLVGAHADEVVSLPATSYGFASVLNNIKGHAKKAITVSDAFPSGYFSMQRWCTENGATLEVVEANGSLELPGADWNARLLEAIDKDTAVVLVPSVHWMTGLRFQLEAIGEKCASVGAAFLVDGTQSVGALPIDVKEYKIDALICAGYKWLMGPYGMALGYIAEKFHTGKPLEESWMNRKNARNFGDLTNYSVDYAEGAGRFNVGEMSHFVLMPMMEAALDQVLAWSPEGIQQYTGQLVLPLLDYFKGKTVPIEPLPYFSSHLFGIKFPKELSTTVFKDNLERAHVFLSQRGEFIRIALHMFNTTEDIATLIDVFEKTYHNGTK